jgi:hypothetical protein
MSDPSLLAGFLSNDFEAGKELRRRYDERLLKIVGPMPAAMNGLGLEEDVLQRTWELVYRKGSAGYSSTRGAMINYLAGHARNAKRDVCAGHAPPGARTRPGKDEDGKSIVWKCPLSLDGPTVTQTEGELTLADAVPDPVDEYARAEDRRYVDELVAAAETSAPPIVVDLLARMRDGNTLGQASAESGVSRFTARRAIDRWTASIGWAA